jgi:hypothetical protein
MTANKEPVWPLTPKIGGTKITAANTKSSGDGTIGTDIFKAFTAGSDGAFVSRIRLSCTATTAATATTATVARVYYSTVTAGATTGGTDTFLLAEQSLPSVSADATTTPVQIFDVPVNAPIPAGSTILVSTHHAPAANTVIEAIVFAGDY